MYITLMVVQPLFHSLLNVHPYFYDRIEIWLEEKFRENVLVNKLIFINMLAISVHTTFKKISVGFIIIAFLLPMFDLYIHAGKKMLE